MVRSHVLYTPWLCNVSLFFRYRISNCVKWTFSIGNVVKKLERFAQRRRLDLWMTTNIMLSLCLSLFLSCSLSLCRFLRDYDASRNGKWYTWVLLQFVSDADLILPVNDRSVINKAKHSWFRVSILWYWRYASRLDEAKSHIQTPIDSLCVLIKACRKSYRVYKLSRRKWKPLDDQKTAEGVTSHT